MVEYLLFRSKKNPGQAVTVGKRPDGTYFVPLLDNIKPEMNTFNCIEEIEQLLDDELELIVSKQ